MLGPQGRRGEVLAELHTDFPERFADRRDLSGLAANGTRRDLHLEEHWFHKGGVVLKFAGVDSITDAEPLGGIEIQIPREQRAELEEGAAYVSELIGCEVWIEGATGQELLGAIADVQFGAGEAPTLVIKRPGKEDGRERARENPGVNHTAQAAEFLVPYAQEFVKSADLGARRIEMQLPEGLLELQTPLSEQEKLRQKREADEARAAGQRRRRRT